MMLWDVIELEFGTNIKPSDIEEDVYDELETKYNDLIFEIKELIRFNKSEKRE